MNGSNWASNPIKKRETSPFCVGCIDTHYQTPSPCAPVFFQVPICRFSFMKEGFMLRGWLQVARRRLPRAGSRRGGARGNGGGVGVVTGGGGCEGDPWVLRASSCKINSGASVLQMQDCFCWEVQYGISKLFCTWRHCQELQLQRRPSVR